MQCMKKLVRYIIPLIAAGILIFIDQYTKYLVVSNMRPYNNDDIYQVIPDVFELRYIQNSGTAWGLFAGMDMHTFFVVMTMILMTAMIYVYIRLSGQKKYLPLNITLVILFAGAAGNMLDRLRLHYVIDFLYFKLIDFPIFNVADIYVVVSMFMLAYLVLFRYEDNTSGSAS